jgi:hypothetical protein
MKTLIIQNLDPPIFMNMSDAVNLIIYAGIPQDGNRKGPQKTA